MTKPAKLLGDLAHGGPLHAGSVRKNADRQTRIVDALEAKLGAGLLVASKLDPFEGNVASLEKVADGVSLRRATFPIKADSWSKFHNRSFDQRGPDLIPNAPTTKRKQVFHEVWDESES